MSEIPRDIVHKAKALQYQDTHGEVCPDNWQKGKPGMTGKPKGNAHYLAQNAGTL